MMRGTLGVEIAPTDTDRETLMMHTSLIIRWATTVVLMLALFTPQQVLHAQSKPKRLDLG